MMRPQLTVVVVAVLMGGLMAGPPTVAAYEADPSILGVAVSGRATFQGRVPKAKLLPVHRDNAVCGVTVPDEALEADPTSRGLAGVIVSVEGVLKGKPLPEDGAVTIENRTCRFFQRANVAFVGSVVRIKNSDPIMHNTHIRKDARFGSTVINVAQPVGAPIIEKGLDEVGVLDVRCDAHTFMRASLHVFDHPYFSVTDQAGRFELTGVPPGKYRLRFWHEKFGAREQVLTVPASGDLSVDLVFDAQDMID